MIDDVHLCGCKGIRSCLLCERQRLKNKVYSTERGQKSLYLYCTDCKAVFQDTGFAHPNHNGETIQFSGIKVVPEFISTQEEQSLYEEIYKIPFVSSQSGRCKQDYGPKVNFKKKRLRADKFTGLPSYAKFLFERMLLLPELSDFQPVELCNLEYSAERGAAIDPHFDDFWLWGERLVTVNLLSSSILSFTNHSLPGIEVQVPLPQRSLIIVSGEARYVWQHAIHRAHIKDKRIAMTWRELTQEFLTGERAEEGEHLLKTALLFQGSAVV